MKFRYLILLFFISFCFFFGIDKAFALTFRADILSMSYHDSDNSYHSVDGGFELRDWYGINFYSANLSSPRNVRATYDTSAMGLTPLSYYDLGFYLRIATIQATYNNVSVVLDNKTCEVHESKYLSLPDNTNNTFQIVSVICSNVYLDSNFSIRVLVDTPFTASAPFGVSQYWYYGPASQQTFTEIKSEIETTNDKLDSVNSSINETNDTLKDDDTSEATGEAGDFFSGFSTNTHGLTGIITAPLTLIGNITSSTCSNLSVPLPFVNQNLSLPCMSSIYSRYFGNFYDMYKIITFGIVAYWVCVRVFALVKDFKNPEHDEIEVMDL